MPSCVDTAIDTEAGRLPFKGGSVTVMQISAVAPSSTVTRDDIAANKTNKVKKKKQT